MLLNMILSNSIVANKIEHSCNLYQVASCTHIKNSKHPLLPSVCVEIGASHVTPAIMAFADGAMISISKLLNRT